jgi:hypothetical protein
MLYQTALFFHFISLLLAGGGMFCVIVAERQLWEKLNSSGGVPATLIGLIQTATKFILISIVLFLLSGLVLLYASDWANLRQPWFIIKFGCFLLFTLNGALVGGKTVEAIDKQLRDKNYNMDVLMKAKKKMGRFHIIQFILVTVMILLATFKVSF